MNPLFRFIWWLLRPDVFLVLRVVADFAGGAWGILSGATLFGVWLLFVGVVTLASAGKELSERKELRELRARVAELEARQ